MAIFLTGSTGYLGSYVVSGLLRQHDERLALLVRAKSVEDAKRRIWKALQLHMGFEEFRDLVESRVDIYLGDITSSKLGQDDAQWARLVAQTDSIVHIAASLNRKSAKTCMNVNLRGSLEVLKLARAAHDSHGVRRVSDVSTTAVAGLRSGELVQEDEAIDWDRSDYDPYARTKKFAEHMLAELLPDVERLVFRPSIVLGDSERAETTQFDMVRAFVMLAKLRVLPFDPSWRLDIVPANYVGKAIVALHQRSQVEHHIYHLSSGAESLTYREIIESLRLRGEPVRHLFVPQLHQRFSKTVSSLADTPREWGVAGATSLLKVFMPYLIFDTVFDNTRVSTALGEKPAPFAAYASRLLDFAVQNDLTYPYREWPEIPIASAVKA
jgi:thioester reductase-like protein